MQDLTPRDGAKKLPPKETMTPEQREEMAEIERLTQDQGAAVAVLAQASAHTAAATEDSAELLEDIKAILVKVCAHFSIPLPVYMAKAIADKEYDPDAGPDDDDDDDDDDAKFTEPKA